MTTLAMPSIEFASPTIQKYNWLCLDIETAQGRPESAERWMRLAWSPSDTWKDETIGSRYRELLIKKRDLLALMDESPVIVISLKSDTELRLLHCCEAQPPKEVGGGLVEGFSTMSEMLIAFRTLLDTYVGPETTLTGHNIIDFDLKRLRYSFIRSGVRMPNALLSKEQSLYDTMHEYCRRFSINKQVMIGLDDVLEEFGITSHKQVLSGRMIPELYDQKEFDVIIQYAMLDVLAESELFLRMVGLSTGLK